MISIIVCVYNDYTSMLGLCLAYVLMKRLPPDSTRELHVHFPYSCST